MKEGKHDGYDKFIVSRLHDAHRLVGSILNLIRWNNSKNSSPETNNAS